MAAVVVGAARRGRGHLGRHPARDRLVRSPDPRHVRITAWRETDTRVTAPASIASTHSTGTRHDPRLRIEAPLTE